jgi:predicted nucleic acid-binding protein
VRVALDINVLVYVEGVNTPGQQSAATRLIARLPTDQTILPAQVIGELFNVLTRKTRRTAASARFACAQWATAYEVIPTTADVLDEAFEIAALHRLASWDAVILAAAAQAGCRYLLSEDMHDGFSWRSVTVVNPFAATALPPPLAALLTGG